MIKVEEILKKDKNLYLLDISWMLYRFHWAHRDMGVMINGFLRPTGHVYGCLNTIKTVRESDPGCTIVICKDGAPVERNEIMASTGNVGYKEGRSELDYPIFKDLSVIVALSCILPDVYLAFNEDKESDDCLYAIAKQAQKCDWNGRVFIHSGDNDLLQSIDDRVSVIRKRNQDKWEEINEEVVKTDEVFTKKFHGVDPKHLPNFRAMVGDASDKINGIPRFPRDIAVKFAMAQDNISEGCKYIPVTDKEIKYYSVLMSNWDLVLRNHKLMKLSEDFEVNITKPKTSLKTIEDSHVIQVLQLNSYNKYMMEELRK